ncbi:MAG: hypothetical protein F2547_06600, partial [Actinobacteria bacterium]|nr:hypothetical protein [Actinomycetota bacterium]
MSSPFSGRRGAPPQGGPRASFRQLFPYLTEHRAERPWQGQNETVLEDGLPEHDKSCYLCAGNTRANGQQNEEYTGCY